MPFRMVWTLLSVVIASIFLVFLIIVGIFGNILVVFVSYTGTRISTKGKALICSLAVADLVQSLNLVFMVVSLANFGHWVLGDFLCQLNAFLTVEFVLVSILNLTAISVNRYFMVVKPNLYKEVFSRRNQTILVAFMWMYPLIFAIAPLFGWSSFKFQPGKCICVFFFSESISYTVALVTSVVFIPLPVIFYTCYKIFREVNHHKIRVKSMATQAPNMNIEEVKITQTLAVVVGAYLICFVPAAAVNVVEMVKSDFKIPLWMDVLSMLLVFSNHANNPLIYGALNKQYRRAFKEIVFDVLRAFRCSTTLSNDLGGSTSRGVGTVSDTNREC